eukprot:6830534-Pyramimonas_sp.AAC.1
MRVACRPLLTGSHCNQPRNQKIPPLLPPSPGRQDATVDPDVGDPGECWPALVPRGEGPKDPLRADT